MPDGFNATHRVFYHVIGPKGNFTESLSWDTIDTLVRLGILVYTCVHQGHGNTTTYCYKKAGDE